MSDDLPVVLLVDDEPRVLSALRRALRREGLTIETASSAEMALERLERKPSVSLVVSDYKMPGRTGVDLLTTIRASWPSTARILLSGWASEIDPASLEAAGCTAVLGKPWDDAELKREIRRALGA